jgi:glutamine amidotransferase
MRTALIDYDSGNLHSAEKAFERMAREGNHGTVEVTQDPETVLRADRVVLPGDGAFPACRAALLARTGLYDALIEVVEKRARPFMGICIGMQMMATRGLEYEPTDGFGWINGEVRPIDPSDPNLKVPHMGWNDLVVEQSHPVLEGVETGAHVYFVHSMHMVCASAKNRLAFADYGGEITAIVGTGTMIGTQFHPEKSQSAGLRIIDNFLRWRP